MEKNIEEGTIPRPLEVNKFICHLYRLDQT